MVVAVCDDDPHDIGRMKKCAARITDYEAEFQFYCKPGEMLHEPAQGQNPDMYILDIEMPGMDGLSVAKEIRSRNSKTLIVFLTGHIKYMADVFEVVTFDFISKPITYERLCRLLDKAAAYLNVTSQKFSFIFRQCRYSLNFDEIEFFEKSGRHVFIHTKGISYKTNMSTSRLWEKLDRRIFAAPHSSYIVNLSHVRSVSYSEVEMGEGDKIPISRGCRKEFTSAYMDFMENGAV